MVDNWQFREIKSLWALTIKTQFQYIEAFSLYLENFALSVSEYEIESKTVHSENDDIWAVEATFDHKASKEFIEKLKNFASNNNLKIYEIEQRDIPDQDWVSAVQKDFTPIEIGRFFITSHFYASQNTNLEKIIINPGRAFGTGAHSTTSGCVQALEKLTSKPIKTILDLGSGSGILAICASRIWPDAEIIGSDIEEIAVQVAQENSLINKAPIKFIEANGFNSPKLDKKFDLIIANILAQPLVELSSDIKSHLNPNGYVILSGFIRNQEEQVSKAYQNLGLKVVDIAYINDWITLLMQQ